VKTLNGEPADIVDGRLLIGKPLSITAPEAEKHEDRFRFRWDPPLMRIASVGTSCLTIKNMSDRSVSGRVEPDLPRGLSLKGRTGFGPIAPGGSGDVTVTLRAGKGAPRGMKRIPYRLRYRVDSGGPQRMTLYEALPAAIGSALLFDYGPDDKRNFRTVAPGYTAESLMLNGLLVKLSAVSQPGGGIHLAAEDAGSHSRACGRPGPVSDRVWHRQGPGKLGEEMDAGRRYPF